MRTPAWLSRLLPGRQRAARRFDAAQYNRLTASWRMSERSINDELRSDLDALRRRARDLAKNEPLAAKYLEMVITNVVGPAGFTLQARAEENGKPSTMDNNAIERAWLDWSKARHCDYTHRLNFPDICRGIVRAVARDGEALVRLIDAADNPYGFALQWLDIERLDTTFNRNPSPGQNQIIMGVEMDGDGRPVAYWLATAEIGRDPTGKKLQRFTAENCLHIYITDDPEQVRGIPWMHASMIRIHHLKGFQEAAIIAARIGASKMGFFVNSDGTAPPLNPDTMSDGEDAAGIPFTEVDPGQFGLAPPGYSFESFNPDYPSANYEAFIKAAKRDIGSGFGAAYHSLANDLEGVNFSSIRSGTLEERDNWMLIQRWFIGAFLDTIFERWLDAALLKGAIRLPGGSPLPASKRQKFMAHEFLGRRWQWVDPLKDINASILAIENGLASPYTIASQQGVDAEDVLDDIARFQAAAKKKGITLGTSPGSGAAAAAAVTPPAGDDSDKPDPAVAKALDGIRAEMQLLSRETPPPAPSLAPHIEVKLGDTNVHLPEGCIQLEATVNVPEQKSIKAGDTVIQVSPSPAPNVTVINEVQPAPIGDVNIVSQPKRKTESFIERDGKGNILRTTQVESDVS